jgi:hypothetical protein
MNDDDDVVVTIRERDVAASNRRGLRPGMFGNSIDAASGKELDRQAAIFSVKRERASLFGLRMPWGQSDEALRSRIYLDYQSRGTPNLCVHNTWCGYADGVRCGDCGEYLVWVTRAQATTMCLFRTKLLEES